MPSADHLELESLRAQLYDALKDTQLWGSCDPSNEERLYVYKLQLSLDEWLRCVERRIASGEAGDEDQHCDEYSTQFLRFYKKASEVRGGGVGKHLGRLAEKVETKNQPQVVTSRDLMSSEQAMPAADAWRELYDAFDRLRNEESSGSFGPSSMITASSVGDMSEWNLSGEERLRDRVAAVAARAGDKLGPEPRSEPRPRSTKVNYWLNRLYLNLKYSKSKLLHQPIFSHERKAALITRVTEASAIFCKQLELQTVEAEPSQTENHTQVKHTEPGKKKLGSKQTDLARYIDAAKLTERQRECFSFKFEYGLNVSEIARKLGITRKTVDQHIHFAKAKMNSSNAGENLRRNLAKIKPEE